MALLTRLFLFTLCTSLTTAINSLSPSVNTTTTTTSTTRKTQHIQQEKMRLTLREVTEKLSNSGFRTVSRLMKNHPELVAYNNMTLFALDDVAIFTGSQGYTNRLLFHLVPNQLLREAELDRLQVGTKLPTLDKGQSLVVTSGGGTGPASIRINGVGLKEPNMMVVNYKMVVHGVKAAFPRISDTGEEIKG